MSNPLIGTTLGSYRIVEHLGDGGMGSVYRAVDDLLERDVALKFLRPALVGHPEIAERFRIEAVALARLQHPNIATLYGFVRSDERMFMVMEFVPGETVQALVEREGKVPLDLALTICEQALHALEYAHRSGIVHRDIKPANLMLNGEGQVKLMDFGVARVLGTERYTRTGLAVGTVTYMSPEQINGPGVDVDGRSDIYSLGVVLYQLITGRVPFHAESEYALMHAHLNTPPPALSAITDVPQQVEAVVLRAMEKQAAHRFQSPAEFRAAITDARTSLAGSARKSGPRRSPRPAGEGKRRKLTDPGAPTVGVRAIRPRSSASKTTPSAGAVPPVETPSEPHPTPDTPTGEIPRVETPVVDIARPTEVASRATEPPGAEELPRAAEQAVSSQAVSSEAPAIKPAPSLEPVARVGRAERSRWLKPAAGAAVVLVLVGGIAWILLLNTGGADSVDLAQAPVSPAAPIETEIQRPRPPTEAELKVAPAAPAAPAEPTPEAAAPAAPLPGAAPAPAPAPSPAPEAIAPALPSRSFENVRLAFRQGDDDRERDVRLTFSPTAVIVADRRSGQTLSELPYAAISGATYVQGRDPRWQDEGARVDLAPRRRSAFGSLGSDPHWLTIQTAAEAVALQVDGGVRRQVLTELAARGVKAEEAR